MTTIVECEPSNAADEAFAEIVYVTLSGGVQAKMSLPHVKTHPRWTLVGYIAYGLRKTTYNGEMEPYEAFVSVEEAAKDAHSLFLCDYSDYGRYQLAGTCNRIVALFRHEGTGKLLVTETFPKKIIVSGGKVAIDR